jgi:hypothetical protein
MPDEKTPPVEEVKWWIDRGPVKEREKETPLGRGIIEKWVTEMLKDYRQEQALRSVVDINQRILKEFTMPPGQWGYLSLEVGSYPAGKLEKIKNSLQLPSNARALAIDAGYSLRVLITAEPVGERLVDINFTEAPSLDYWVAGELVEERLFSTVDDTLKKLRGSLHSYFSSPK